MQWRRLRVKSQKASARKRIVFLLRSFPACALPSGPSYLNGNSKLSMAVSRRVASISRATPLGTSAVSCLAIVGTRSAIIVLRSTRICYLDRAFDERLSNLAICQGWVPVRGASCLTLLHRTGRHLSSKAKQLVGGLISRTLCSFHAPSSEIVLDPCLSWRTGQDERLL